MMKYIHILILIGIIISGCASVGVSPQKEGAYFITPQNGETVINPFTVRFGLSGKGIAPAGVKHPNSGHHHLLIDVEKLPPLNLPIPKNEKHRHYGGGHTETTLELSPGTHTLQLLLGDQLHIPHNPPALSEKIIIRVVDPLMVGKKGVYIITPKDNAVVSSPVKVKFGLKGMGLAPAGVKRINSGHHHLLIDVKNYVPTNQPLLKNKNYLHFGAGQSEASIELSPGKHTLQLVVGDHLHKPHKPPVISKPITITVK